MRRECRQCQDNLSSSKFSCTQWAKGEGSSRCFDCVNGTIRCRVCDKSFNNSNELKMHMQVHQPRDVGCPICHETRFRTGANAVQHVESGYCKGCRGAANARDQIYKFARQQRAMQPYMSNVPLLTNGDYDNATPELPYDCSECNKQFRQLSQLLQHQAHKHSNARLLTY